MMKPNPLSFQMKLNPEDFLPATDEEKQSHVIMRESVGFWKDGFRRLVKNKVAMVSNCACDDFFVYCPGILSILL